VAVEGGGTVSLVGRLYESHKTGRSRGGYWLGGLTVSVQDSVQQLLSISPAVTVKVSNAALTGSSPHTLTLTLVPGAAAGVATAAAPGAAAVAAGWSARAASGSTAAIRAQHHDLLKELLQQGAAASSVGPVVMTHGLLDSLLGSGAAADDNCDDSGDYSSSSSSSTGNVQQQRLSLMKPGPDLKSRCRNLLRTDDPQASTALLQELPTMMPELLVQHALTAIHGRCCHCHVH